MRDIYKVYYGKHKGGIVMLFIVKALKPITTDFVRHWMETRRSDKEENEAKAFVGPSVTVFDGKSNVLMFDVNMIIDDDE